MNEALFMQEVDLWLGDIRQYALSLFNEGVPSERVLGIATAIADGKAVKRALMRQAVSGIPGMSVRKIHGA
jgi:hypothetical protein